MYLSTRRPDPTVKARCVVVYLWLCVLFGLSLSGSRLGDVDRGR